VLLSLFKVSVTIVATRTVLEFTQHFHARVAFARMRGLVILPQR
jgi:hypothetical protein